LPGRIDIVRKAEELLEGHLLHLGYELVACEWTTDLGRPTLKVFIDCAGGVGIQDCRRVSGAVGDLLEVEELIDSRYHLEISSPGLDRPLRKEPDFLRFVGEQVRIRTFEALDGRRNFKGTLEAVDDGIVTVRIDNTPFRVAIAAMDRANLIYDFNKDLRR
jgi:ribosome maturation factor RimP